MAPMPQHHVEIRVPRREAINPARRAQRALRQALGLTSSRQWRRYRKAATRALGKEPRHAVQ